MTAKGRLLNMKRDGYPEGAVCIDRGTAYGNPFYIGVHGTREQVCDLHMVWARCKAEENPAWLEYLRGRDLICWCAPHRRCHGENYLILLHGEE